MSNEDRVVLIIIVVLVAIILVGTIVLVRKNKDSINSLKEYHKSE